jgi:phosphoribosylformylglycinamidine synthase
MTSLALDEGIRKIISLGGRLGDIYFNGNVCWPSPLPSKNNTDAEYKMGQLVRTNQSLEEGTTGRKAPSISGKDSMSMDGTVPTKDGGEKRVSAPPVILFHGAGTIEDIRKCVTMDVKSPGDVVYVLGLTKDELGGSEFYKTLGETGRNVPVVDGKAMTGVCNALSDAIENGAVRSAHGCYKGGLGIALAQMSFAGGYGLDIDLSMVPRTIEDDTKILYSESAGRFVVTVSPDKADEFEKTMQGNAYAKIGYVRNDENLRVKGVGNSYIVNENIGGLKESWKSTFRNF